MKFQHKLMVITALLCGFSAIYPAAGRVISKMKPREISALDPSKLLDEEKVQVLFTALFSGLEHQRSAARNLINNKRAKDKREKIDFDVFRKDLVDAGLDPLINMIKNEAERTKIKEAYLQGLFSGLEHKRGAARKVVDTYVASKGLAPIDWKKLAERVKHDGYEAMLGRREGSSSQVSGEQAEAVQILEEALTEPAQDAAQAEAVQILRGALAEPAQEAAQAEAAQLLKDAFTEPARAQEGLSNIVILPLPQAIAQATGKQNVNLDLDENEAFTQESFRELRNGGSRLVIVLSQNRNDGTWDGKVYDAESFEEWRRSGNNVDVDPYTGLEIKHVIPV